MFLENIFIGLLKLVVVGIFVLVVFLILLGFSALWNSVPVVGPVIAGVLGVLGLAWIIGAWESW